MEKKWHWYDKTTGSTRLIERVAHGVVNGMSSPEFFVGQTIFIVVWIAANLIAEWAFDKYPFILLNLGLSLQAAYSGLLILISSRRQEARDRAQADADHEAITVILEKLDQLLDRE